MSLATDDPRHGTPNGYGNLGCRCAACRDAFREYIRVRGISGYKRVPCECGRPKLPAAVRCQACERARRAAQHGSEARYRNGCRCDDCTTAAREAKRGRRERSRVPCSHGCGRLVVGINRDYPDKPPECQPCAMKRVNGARRKTAA